MVDMLDHLPTSGPDHAIALPLRGREAEREQLAEALIAAAHGTPAVVVIEGEPGSGRTRLLQEAAVLARRLGLETRAAGAPDLAEAIARGPVAVLADAGAPPAAVPASAAPAAWVVVGATAPPGARRIALGPLDDAAVAAIAADRVGGRPARSLLDQAARAEGNAGLLVALLDGLVADGRLRPEDGGRVGAGDRGGPPGALRAHVAARLAALDLDTAQVVRVAAALGPSCTLRQIGRMLDRTPAQLLVTVEDAIRAGVLVEGGDRLRFRHELVRATLLAALPGAVRRGLRAQAAEVLVAGGARGADVAEQLADGAEDGDAGAAARILEAAAQLAPSDGARAAALARRGVAVCPPADPARPAMVARAIRILRRADRHAEAEELGLRTLERPLTAAEEAGVRLSLSMLDEQPWSIDRAQHNVRALRQCDPAPGLRARHRAWLAYNLVRAGRLEAAGAAVEHAARDGDPVALLAGAALAAARGDHAGALAALEAMPRLGATDDELDCACLARYHRALALAATGRVTAARASAGEGLAAARRNDHAWAIRRWGAAHALLDLMAGRLDGAEDHARAVAGARALDADADTALARAVLVAVARHRGDRATALDAAAAAREVLGALPVTAPAAAPLRWLVALATGDAGALRDARAAPPPDPAWDPDAALDAAAVAERPLLRAARLEAEDAVAALEAARDLYAAAGATGDVARVDARRAEHGAGPSAARRQTTGWAALTTAELRVVRLVGAGATNREAAAQLFLSPHTVSSHLRRAFAKLEINSRVELARVVLRHDGA
jgi:DNA-binding CsgD family transcriptional regulator